jgi:hypothetical protein
LQNRANFSSKQRRLQHLDRHLHGRQARLDRPQRGGAALQLALIPTE